MDKEKIVSPVGKRIRERREQLGFSVSKLADLIGKNQATVYRYESNEIEDLPVSILEPLARALQTTPAYLMGWVDKLTDEEEQRIQEANRLTVSIGRGGERQSYEISEADAAILDAFLKDKHKAKENN